MDLRNKRILVTGGAGFLGSHVVENLKERGVRNIFVPRSVQYDLREREACREVVQNQDIVIHIAAKVGGIGYNTEKPGELFYDNILMGVQLMEEARRAGVEKFVALGTVCAYPKFAPIPFQEDSLWNGYPEETNAPYGLAKKMLLVQAQAYRAQYGFNAIYLLPVNLFGPRDNFNPNSSHVIPALIKKALDAKTQNSPYLEVWGSGSSTREFLYVEDAAEAVISATERYDKKEPVNLGSGREISISELVDMVCVMVGYKGEIRWNRSKPDGQPRRRLDTSRALAEFGFKAKTPFTTGLQKTISWYFNIKETREQIVRISA